jgi:hypothetical protein
MNLACAWCAYLELKLLRVYQFSRLPNLSQLRDVTTISIYQQDLTAIALAFGACIASFTM